MKQLHNVGELYAMTRPSVGRIHLYGVVLYTNSHANITKVLRDQDYWDAFDEISGPNWAVFAIRSAPGRHRWPRVPLGTMACMVPIWSEPRENLQLLKRFGLSSSESFPLLLVFTDTLEGEVLSTGQRLDDASVDAAFASLKNALTLVTVAVSRIHEENFHEAEGVHGAIQFAVRNAAQFTAVKKGIRTLGEIKSFFGM
jgi:hypothetical protein